MRTAIDVSIVSFGVLAVWLIEQNIPVTSGNHATLMLSGMAAIATPAARLIRKFGAAPAHRVTWG